MGGREEHDIKVKTQTLKIIDNSDPIMKKYYNSLRGKTEKTKNVYIKYIKDFCDYFKDDTIYTLRRSDIEGYLEARSINKRTGSSNGFSIINTRIAAIKGFYDFLVDDEYLDKNPAEKIAKLKVVDPKPIISMTPLEIKRVKRNIIEGVGTRRQQSRQKKWKSRDIAIVSLGCSTGLRCSAITEINIDDINMDNMTMSVVEKGEVKRTVYFGENVREILLNWIADRQQLCEDNTNALFISDRGTRISNQTISNILKRYTCSINKHITPHKMRSSCATNLYNKTNDIYIVQEVLGHKNIANTRRYAAISEENRRKATDILDSI